MPNNFQTRKFSKPEQDHLQEHVKRHHGRCPCSDKAKWEIFLYSTLLPLSSDVGSGYTTFGAVCSKCQIIHQFCLNGLLFEETENDGEGA